MLTKQDARRVAEILEEAAKMDAPPTHVARRLHDALPHATLEDVRHACRAFEEEKRMEGEDALAEVVFSKRMVELITEAREMSGEEFNTGEALQFLAGRGHLEAQQILQALTDEEAERYSAPPASKST